MNDLEENRNWFTMRLWAVVYTVGFLVAFVFVLGVLVFGNTLHNLAVGYIPVIKDFAEVLAHFRGLVLLGILFVFFVVIFTTLPNKKLQFRRQVPGAANLCNCMVCVFVCTIHLCGLF